MGRGMAYLSHRLSLVVLAAFLAPACGGQFNANEQEGGLAGQPLLAEVHGRRVTLRVESGEPVMWADLGPGDQLWIEFKGKRYLYRHVVDQPAEICPAEDGSDGFAVGGNLSRGAVIGFPNYAAGGDVEPHALKVHDVRATVNPAEVSYRFASCPADARKGHCEADDSPKELTANNTPDKIDDIFEVRFEKLGGARLGAVGLILQPALDAEDAVTAWTKTPVGQRLTGNELSQEASDNDGGDRPKSGAEVIADKEGENADLEAKNARLKAEVESEKDDKDWWKSLGMLTMGVIGGAILVCAMSDSCMGGKSSETSSETTPTQSTLPPVWRI